MYIYRVKYFVNFTILLLSIELDSQFETNLKDFDKLLKFMISVFNSFENASRPSLSSVLDNKSQTDIVPDNDFIRLVFFRCFII